MAGLSTEKIEGDVSDFQRNREATRERILAAAEALTQQRSADYVQIREVAKHAKASPALIIRYFNSKDELFFEAAIRRLRKRMAEFEEVVQPTVAAMSIEQFIQLNFDRDLSVPHNTRDILGQGWRWTRVEEELFEEASRPRSRALYDIVVQTMHPGMGGGPAAERVSETIRAVYFHVLRRALVYSLSKEQASAACLDMLSPLLDCIRQHVKN